MTTNAIDKKKKVIASDSRWSIQRDELLFFVDDTGFDKISDRAIVSMICAGDAVLIDDWRKWFYTRVLNTAAMPRTERLDQGVEKAITISVIGKPDGAVVFTNGWYLTHGDEAMFSGSGAVYAKDCFSQNGCGKRSVATAAESDPATGGETKFVEISTNNHNLHQFGVTHADAQKLLSVRGLVMNTETKKVVPIQEYAATNGGALRAIMAGEVSLSAPTGQAHKAWTEAERQELKAAMERIAALEAAQDR